MTLSSWESLKWGTANSVLGSHSSLNKRNPAFYSLRVSFSGALVPWSVKLLALDLAQVMISRGIKPHAGFHADSAESAWDSLSLSLSLSLSSSLTYVLSHSQNK